MPRSCGENKQRTDGSIGVKMTAKAETKETNGIPVYQQSREEFIKFCTEKGSGN